MTFDDEYELGRQRVRLEQDGAVKRDVGVIAPGFVRAVHPDHGEPVTFVPGELLPPWAAALLRGGQGRFDADAGVFILDGVPTRSRGRRSAA